MRCHSTQQRGPYAGDPVESGQSAEAAVRLTIGHDPRRKPRPDPRQSLQLVRTGTVEVDPFIGAQRPRCPQDAVPLRRR